MHMISAKYFYAKSNWKTMGLLTNAIHPIMLIFIKQIHRNNKKQENKFATFAGKSIHFLRKSNKKGTNVYFLEKKA